MGTRLVVELDRGQVNHAAVQIETEWLASSGTKNNITVKQRLSDGKNDEGILILIREVSSKSLVEKLINLARTINAKIDLPPSAKAELHYGTDHAVCSATIEFIVKS